MQDQINFLNKLSSRKVYNASKILYSYYHSKRKGQPNISGYPWSLSVEPTTSCNLRCPECPSGLRSFTRPTGMLDLDFFQGLIEEVKDHLIYLLLYFQGEPYLHQHFFDLVSIAAANKIYTSTSTNAHYLTETNAEKTVRSGLDRLIISIDGTTQETYQQYRIGGNLEKVIDGTERLLFWKKKLKSTTPHTIFQYLVVKPNEHQVNEVKVLARSLGVDQVVFKTAQIYDYKDGSPLIPQNPKYARYRKLPDGTYQLKNELLDHCWKMWHSCVVTWDGKVVPCCFDKDATHVMGDLNKDTLKEIWRNDNYERFRKALLTSRSSIDICQNCSEGTKVWA